VGRRASKEGYRQHLGGDQVDPGVPPRRRADLRDLGQLERHKGKNIQAWCAKHNVELCLAPTYSPWAKMIECHFGPLRDFVLNNSDHPNHVVLTCRLHAYLAWRNTHDADPAMRERLRRERARLRSERQRPGGRPATVSPPAAVAA